MRPTTSFLIAAVACACVAQATAGRAPFSVDKAVQIVRMSSHSSGPSGPIFDLQVRCRLGALERHPLRYVYEPAHAPAWKSCMLDAEENMYARLCAAYFLLDQHVEAREFIEVQLRSTNLRHRYNAVAVVERYVGRDSSKRWGINLLIGLLVDGSIDDSGVPSSPPGEYPDGDRNDIVGTPLGDVCGALGLLKEKSAVPALISVLERRPNVWGAAFALGEIGDKRAIPILLTILKERSGYANGGITALGKLKCNEAVPVLLSRLGIPKKVYRQLRLDVYETGKILEALEMIGDDRAVPAIEGFLRGDPLKKAGEKTHLEGAARRVLAQLASSDPVESLLTLFDAETYEPERSDIISALVKYKGTRVVERLATIARQSDSAFMRRQAIFGLRDIQNRESLLVLASLLDLVFSNDLKARWGWKSKPNFQEYFPETIAKCLTKCTGQDFGQDRKKWEAWITKNVQPGHPGDQR